MIRWKLTKLDPKVKLLLERFTDIQNEIEEWKSLSLTASWAYSKGIELMVNNILMSWEKYD